MRPSAVLLFSVWSVTTAAVSASLSDLCTEPLPPHCVRASDADAAAAISPDGKFVAAIAGPHQGRLVVYRRLKNGTRGAAVFSAPFPTSFVWQPRRTHALLFGTSDTFDGVGCLGRWTKGQRFELLGESRDHNTPGFEICGITLDGQFLYYHIDSLEPGFEARRKLRIGDKAAGNARRSGRVSTANTRSGRLRP